MRTATYDVPPQEVKESCSPTYNNALPYIILSFLKNLKIYMRTAQRRCPSLSVPKIALPSLYSRLMRRGGLSTSPNSINPPLLLMNAISQVSWTRIITVSTTINSNLLLQILTKDSVTVFVNAIMYYKVCSLFL